ncbi:hypothetical protein [Hufsiella ginkgonis]|uniref:GNAT family N-acetyltransferase n=1 Tax=Hufsiella ginkgonis TaxID=2695274 RepID=A0A7K1XTT2_9SPHI|nr:hypothetical protein [Hufsiella ginkgonis]MXV14384.1 hypothetical protein [Hufsiella ginkgonis]
MDYTLNKENPVVRLRAFRATDDPAACALFVEGHTHVLTNIGVTKVTSNKHEWTRNPAAFVLIVESLDGEKVYGGARVHVAGGTEPLPVEQATGALDPSIFDLVYQHARHGTGEICGLWNSREIAGYGIGSIFLTRAAVAISTQIGLQSLFALCAPYTVKMAESVGYGIETSIGNEGTFYYPKLDLLATTMILKDVATLKTAQSEDREAIFKLRENLNLVKTEVLRKKNIEIHYDILIPGLENWHLDEVIANAKKNFTSIAVNERNLNLF